jgi:hypothetical protein
MMIATVICYITRRMDESKEKGKGKKKKKHNPEGDEQDEHTSESSKICII